MTTQERQELKRLIDEARRRKISKQPQEGICLNCEQEFTPICATQKYCCLLCRRNHWHKKKYWLDQDFRDRRLAQKRRWRQARAA